MLNKTKKAFLALFLIVFASLCVYAEDEIIDDVRILGIEKSEEKDMLGKISYGPGMVFSTYKTREDIRNLYKTGRFDNVSVFTLTEDDKTILVYELTEKPKIEKIVISGNKGVGEGDIKGKFEISDEDKPAVPTSVKDEDTKTEKPKIKENEFFDEFILKKVIVQIEKMYKEKNFYYATVSYEVSEPAAVNEKNGKFVQITIKVNEGDKVKVKSIKAAGNNVFSVDKIKGLMKTKEEGWFVSGVFDDDQFIEDLKSIIRAYYQEGYVKAKINGYTLGELEGNKADIVKNYVVFDVQNNAINIEIPITENMQYKIKAIEIEGNELFTTEEIMDKLESKQGRSFDRIKFESDLMLIRSMYSEKGHIFAQFKDAYIYDDDTGEVAIKLSAEEGPVAYINQIKVRGNYVTKDKVITRELFVEENEPFDSTKIKKSQEAVYNLGFFDNVVIDTEQVSMDKLNLIFEVVERKTNTIGLGAGYSTVEGLVGYLQLTNANLFGEAKSFSADVQFGNKKKSWQLGYKDPWFFDTPTSFGVDVWNIFKNKLYNNQGYDLDTYGLDLSFGRRLNNNNKVFLTYRYQQDTYSAIDDALKPYVKEGGSQVSSLTPMYVFDDRDDIFDPNRGIYNTMSLQFGGGLLGGDYNYIKGLWDFRYFVPVYWKFVLGVHARIGNGWGYGSSYGDAAMPPTEKFYAGGTDTVRGYDERALGPIAGGNFLAVTNVELKLKLIDRMLTLVSFYDSGNCWENARDVDWSNPYLYPGFGFGIRFTVPGTVMLIRLDWGYALDPNYHVNGGKIHFNIGNIF
jgi:outer membrane protein insertion porin family